MKNRLSKFSMYLIIFFIVTFLLILIFSFLQYKSLISPTFFNITNIMLSLILFFTTSTLIGYKVHKKGWLVGTILNILYLIIVIILINITKNKLDVFTILLIVIRMLTIFFGSILGVNLRKE